MVADKKLEDLQFEKIEDSEGKFFHESRRLTPFGEATFGKFIEWWLNNNLNWLNEIKQRLEKLQPSLVRLKRQSEKVKTNFDGENYKELIEKLDEFISNNRKEILGFYDFIKWLSQVDKLAPSFFFTHPEWSTSQLSDRLLSIKKDTPTEKEVKMATEVVVGLRTRYEPTFERVRSDMIAERAEAADPEFVTHISIPAGLFFRRASNKVLNEFALYFEKIRICGQNILSKIDSFVKSELIKNESFLRLFIAKTRQNGRTETDLWDFKQTIEAWHNSSEPILGVKFSNDVASFANKYGGLILIGISDDRQIVGVLEAETRIKQTKAILERHLGTIFEKIEILSLPIDNEIAEKFTCLIIVIPQTKDPVKVRAINKSYFYPRRKGVEIERVSHDEIVRLKKDVYEDNFMFARHLVAFVYEGILVG